MIAGAVLAVRNNMRQFELAVRRSHLIEEVSHAIFTALTPIKLNGAMPMDSRYPAEERRKFRGEDLERDRMAVSFVWRFRMPKILIVDDDAGIRKALKKFLAEEGYETIAAASGVEAERLAFSETPALILMDIMMPGRDGREVTRHLRRRGFLRPIIMMSCKGGDEDTIIGLEAGADDYIVKPFNNHVLLARIHACLRRWENRENADTVCRSGALAIDFERRVVTRNGERVKVTGTEYDLLHALARKKGEAVSRDDLQRAVWNSHNFVWSRALDVHVRALRRKLEDDPADPRHILTAQGVGYRFV